MLDWLDLPQKWTLQDICNLLAVVSFFLSCTYPVSLVYKKIMQTLKIDYQQRLTGVQANTLYLHLHHRRGETFRIWTFQLISHGGLWEHGKACGTPAIFSLKAKEEMPSFTPGDTLDFVVDLDKHNDLNDSKFLHAKNRYTLVLLCQGKIKYHWNATKLMRQWLPAYLEYKEKQRLHTAHLEATTKIDLLTGERVPIDAEGY